MVNILLVLFSGGISSMQCCDLIYANFIVNVHTDQESVPTKIATVSTADGHGGHVQKEVWRQRYLVLDDELSEEDSDEVSHWTPWHSFTDDDCCEE